MLVRLVLVSVASAATALCASLKPVSDFGPNPTKIVMNIVVPAKLATKPAVIVALHGCMNSAQTFYPQTKMPSLSDQLGFIMIYPTTPNQNSCWDVQSPNSLTHGNGGDAAGIISMIDYTIKKYDADPAKIFVFGSSSGAMMTNVLCASYPEVFEAAAAYSGVAHACFAGAPAATPQSPNQTCAQGLSHTGAEWANFVHNSYPGYTGKRPRIQIWHGLVDTLVRPAAGFEALKQWSAVLEQPLTKNNSGVPSSAYTQMVYGDGTKLQGYIGQGVGHVAPVNEQVMLKFFGLTT